MTPAATTPEPLGSNDAVASANPVASVTHHDGGVALVTFQNAERMNSFDPAIIRALRGVMGDLLEDDAVRAIVLTGSGRAFSTGADVKDMARAAKDGTATQWVLDATEQLHPLLFDIHGSHKPVIAAVNGVAAGGGLGLALAADARIGSPEARFAAGYFGIGLVPDGGATWLLPRLMGIQRTKHFFFNNEVMDAETAHFEGLLDQVVPAGQLVDEAIALAARWGSWAKHSRESTKRLLESSASNDFVAQMDMERGLIASAAGTANFREGTTAFVEKRKPTFQ